MVVNATYFANMTNVTRLSQTISYVQSVTGDQFGNMLLVSIFAVVFFSLKSYTTERAATAASFMTFISAVMLSPIGLAGANQIIITAIFTLITVFWLYYSRHSQ